MLGLRTICTDDSAALLAQLTSGLELVVALRCASQDTFGDLEIEKLVYHFVANACEKGEHSLVRTGVSLLESILAKEPAGPAETLPFPRPSPHCPPDLPRLVTGVILNGLKSLLAQKPTFAATRKLALGCASWTMTMIRQGDARSSDYVGRACKIVAALAARPSFAPAESLNLHADVFEIRWTQTYTPAVEWFSDAHAVGIKASGKKMDKGVVDFYVKVDKCATQLRSSGGSTLNDVCTSPAYLKWLLHFFTMCTIAGCSEIRKSALAAALGRLDSVSKGSMNGAFARATLLITSFAMALREAGNGVSSLADEAISQFLGESVEATRSALGMHERYIEKSEKLGHSHDAVALLVMCWRAHAKVPTWAGQGPFLTEVKCQSVLESSLEQLAALSNSLLSAHNAVTAETTEDSAVIAQTEELLKLQPHIQASLVEAATKVAALCSTRLSSKATNKNTLGLLDKAIDGLAHAEGMVTGSTTAVRRIAAAYSQMGKALSDCGLYGRAILPLMRSCAALERTSSTVSAEVHATLLEETKVSSRFASLSGSLLQCGEKVAATLVLRHAICLSPEVNRGYAPTRLVERFVRLQENSTPSNFDTSNEDRVLPASTKSELQQQPCMVVRRGDCNSDDLFLHLALAAQGLSAEAQAAVALAEMRALHSVVGDQKEIGSHLVARFDKLHSFLVKCKGCCEVHRSAATVALGVFYHLAAFRDGNFLGRLTRDSDVSQATVGETMGRPEDAVAHSPELAAEFEDSEGSQDALERAHHLLSKGVASLESLKLTGVHSRGAAALELTFGQLAQIKLHHRMRMAASMSSSKAVDLLDAAFENLALAMTVNGGKDDQTCACCTSIQRPEETERLKSAASIIGDYFAWYGNLTKQAQCYMLARYLGSAVNTAQVLADRISCAFVGTGVALGPLEALSDSDRDYSLGRALVATALGNWSNAEDELAKLLPDSSSTSNSSSSSHAQSEVSSRVRCAAMLARASLKRRRGNLAEELAELRAAAGFCGGRAAGQWARCGPSVIPKSETSLWFGLRYAEVLLQLGQEWAARGAYMKALHYVECAAHFSDAPLFRRGCQTAKLSLFLSLQRLDEVDALLESEPHLPLGPALESTPSKEFVSESWDIGTPASALLDIHAFIARGDVCRRRGSKESFNEASRCYTAASSILARVSSPTFVAPLLQVLGAQSSGTSPPSIGSCSAALKGDVLWRHARMLWLTGYTAEALSVYQEILNLPGCTHALAVAHYRMGRSELEHAAEPNLESTKEHLLLAAVAAERNPRPKLLRNIQRALAASSACDSTESRACLLGRSIGAANIARMLELTQTSQTASKRPASLVPALEALRGAPLAEMGEPLDGTRAAKCAEALSHSAAALQKGVDDLPPDWVICSVSVAPQGGLLVSRQQASRPATVVHLESACLDEVLDEFDAFIAQNRKSLGEHSDGAAAALDRHARAAWWEQRQELDDTLHAVLALLEDTLGWGKALFFGDFGDEPGRVTAAQVADRIVANMANGEPPNKQRKGAKASRVDEAVLRACVLAASSLSPAHLEDGLRCAFPDAASERLKEIAPTIESYGASNGASGGASCRPSDPNGPSPTPMTLAECNKLKVSDLKVELGNLGLSTVGLKKDLAERLHGALNTTPDSSEAENVELADSDRPAHRGPVVLVLDERLQRLPWEGMECLRALPVYRAPSLAFVLAHGTSAVVTDGIKVSDGFYFLDPEGNLPRTRSTLAPLVQDLEQRLGWEGIVGSAPPQESVSKELLERDLVMYCGHGAGERLIGRELVTKLPRCAAMFLMGCSSGQLHLQGDFEPSGMAAAYFSAGCPALVANLWDVTDKDIDRFTDEFVRAFTVELGCSLADALAAGRRVCKFTGLTGLAPVCYGVPLRSAAAK